MSCNLLLSVRQEDIVYRLWRKHSFSRNRTTFVDDIVKNAPSHLKAQMQAELDDLIKRNVVIRIPHRGGYKVYINPTYRKKIEAHLKKVFKFI